MVQLMRSDTDNQCLKKVKLEVQDENPPLHTHKRPKLETPPKCDSSDDSLSIPPTSYNPLDEPSPLGLRLKKSPSLLDLIQMRLSQQEESKKKDQKASAASAASAAADSKLKASNFPGAILKIGTWEYKSRYEGDLVAKCYFAKHKLVWEVLDGCLKNKIEIPWSDIMALKANYPEDGPGSLEVVVTIIDLLYFILIVVLIRFGITIKFSLTPASNTYKGLAYSNDREIQFLKSISKSSQNEETVNTKMDEGNLNSISAHVSQNDENSMSAETGASPSQLTLSMKVGDVDLADSTRKDEILVPSSPIQEVTPQLCSLQDVSPKGTVDDHGPDNNYHSVLNVSQSPLTKSGIGISSGKKRKGVQILRNRDKIDKIGRIDRTPEAHSNGSVDLQLVLEQRGSVSRERGMLGDQTSNDVDLFLKKFLAGTNHLLPPSIDKLNLRLIGRLEDILVNLQKVKETEIICSEIQSQHKITDPLNIHRDKRVAETRILLHNIAYEKAKLQLLLMKHDKLLNKVQQINSGLQECEMIKLNFFPSSSKHGAMDTQANDNCSEGKSQVSCKKVLEKKQELESLESKAKSLSKFLQSHCKMNGDESYTDTVKAVYGYFQKRMPCKSIRQNLKSWEIEDFECKDGFHKVCLNYCGYVTQRVTLNTGQSRIITSTSLNDANIGKTFPNLDAFSAFVFVLNPHTTKKFIDSCSMARETQITSSLLSNLLDVVEEVQSARIEIRNLVDAKFYAHSVQRLDLQLSFIDFHSGRKVKAVFDITSLKCGVYPSGVVPYEILDSCGGEEKSLPSSLADEIKTATERARDGYSRITNLCRCISHAVHSGFLKNQMVGN